MKQRIIHSIVLFLTVIVVESCAVMPRQFPVSTKQSDNNKDYQVSFLFEHDGCKVYRFADRGEFIYFTSCNGETTKAQTDSTGVKRMKVINKNRP
jgi:Domain of unknown function (DUF4884)